MHVIPNLEVLPSTPETLPSDPYPTQYDTIYCKEQNPIMATHIDQVEQETLHFTLTKSHLQVYTILFLLFILSSFCLLVINLSVILSHLIMNQKLMKKHARMKIG